MNLKYIYIFLITILLLPLNFAELQPAFLDKDTHYLGEEINLGLIGIIPEDLNYVNIKVILYTGTIYNEINREIDYLADYFFVFPQDFIDNRSNIVYTYYNFNNQIISTQTYPLVLYKIPELDNLQFCISNICESNNVKFIEDENLFLQVNSAPADFSYNVKIISDWYVIDEIKVVDFPVPLELYPGNFEIKITPDYNGVVFETKSLLLTILPKTYNHKQTWAEYFSPEELKIEDVTTAIIESDLPVTNNRNTHEGVLKYWWILIIIAIIILIFSFAKMPKNKDKGETENNRRLNRKEMGFLFLVLFLILVSPLVFASQDKLIEYKNTEIQYSDFKELYPHPEIFNLSISESQNNNTIYYPLTAESLNEFDKIKLVLNNKTPNITMSLESILFARDITTLPENISKPLTNCEQILFWYDKNPITKNINTITDRTKENLIKNINVDVPLTPKIASDTDYAETCISDLINKGYLYEKKILLKINYTEKDVSNISEKEDIQDEIIFENNGKDVLETTFLGSDLNHIRINVNFVSEILRDEEITFLGISNDRIIASNLLLDGEKINVYSVPFLDASEELSITYDVQIINLEIIESDYGEFIKRADTIDYGNKGRSFVISKSSFWALKTKILQNYKLSGKVSLNNGNYKFDFDDESLKLLAEINHNPLKYIIIDKKQIITIGNNRSKITLGIDKNYGVVVEDIADTTIFLESDKVINRPKDQKNQNLGALNNIFIKSSSEKNLEFVRQILPIIYVFSYSENNLNSKNSDESFLKTYDSIADLINKGEYTALEKNIIFNNLISLTEDYCFQISTDKKIHCFDYKTRFVLNYGLVDYIDHPENIQNINPDKLPSAIPRLYYNDYLKRKGFIDSSLNELLVWGLIGDRFGSYISGQTPTLNTNWQKDLENKIKYTIKEIFANQKVNSDNIGYYKDLLSYPFYRLGSEQKECWYDLNNQQILSAVSANKNYCYQAYNIRPQNLGTIFDVLQVTNWGQVNINAYAVTIDDLQNQLYSAYRTQILIDDAYFTKTKISFNQNKISLKKINLMINLIEGLSLYDNLSGIGEKQGEAVLLSYKLNELWNNPDNELKKLDTDKQITNTILKINNFAVYNASTKLRETIKQDRALRLNTYKIMRQNSWDKYVDGIEQGGTIGLEDSALFLITGGWFESGLHYLGVLDERAIMVEEQKDRQNYDKLLNGACCISQRLGELDNKNWTATQIKLKYRPHKFVFGTNGENLLNTPSGLLEPTWITDGVGCTGLVNKSTCEKDIKYLYADQYYGHDTSIILDDYDPRSISDKQYLNKYYITNDLTGYYYSKNIQLYFDAGVQLNNTNADLKKIGVDYKPSAITSILRNIDAGINPTSIILTIATAGVGHGLATGTGGFFTKVASGFTAKLGTSTTGNKFISTLTQRVIYELGENAVIDGAYGALLVAKPDLVTKNSVVTYMVLGVVAGKVQGGTSAIKGLDNTAAEITDGIVGSAKLKNADDTLKSQIKNIISTELTNNAEDRTNLLVKIKNGELSTSVGLNAKEKSLFTKISKLADGDFSIDATKISTRLKKELKVSISKKQVEKLLTENETYALLKKQQVDEFFAIRNKLERIEYQRLHSNDILITNQNGLIISGFSKEYINIEREYYNLIALNRINADKFMGGRGLKFDEFGKVIGYYKTKAFGETLAEHIYRYGDSPELLKQLDEAISSVHAKGYAHGKLTLNNIFVTKAGDSFEIYIGSPAGYPDFITNPELFREAKKFDLDCIADIKSKIKTRNLGTYLVNESNRPRTFENAKLGDIIAVFDDSETIVVGKVVDIKNDIVTLDFGHNHLVDYPYSKTRVARLDIGSIINVRGEVGEIVDLTTDGKVISRLNNGDIKYYDADLVLDSQSIFRFRDQTDPRIYNFLNIADNQSYGSFKKYPDQFALYHNSWPTQQFAGSGEILYVNKKDPIIQEYLKNVKELTSGIDDPKLKLQKIYDYSSNIFNTSDDEFTQLLAETKIFDNQLITSEFLPLSYFITTRTGVCRHHAMLIKLGLDEINIPSEYSLGYVSMSGGGGGHAWVVAKINGEEWLIDPAQQKFTSFDGLSFEDRSYIEHSVNSICHIYEIPKTMDTTPSILKKKLDVFTESNSKYISGNSEVFFNKVSKELNEKILTKQELESLSKLYLEDMSQIYAENRGVFKQLDQFKTIIKNQTNIDPQFEELKRVLKKQYNLNLELTEPNVTSENITFWVTGDIEINKLRLSEDGEEIIQKLKEHLASEILSKKFGKSGFCLAPTIDGQYKIISRSKYLANFEDIQRGGFNEGHLLTSLGKDDSTVLYKTTQDNVISQNNLSNLADATAQALEIIEGNKKILARINLDISQNYNPNNLNDLAKLDDASAALRRIYREEGLINFKELNLSSNGELVNQLNNRILEIVRNQISELNEYYTRLSRQNVSSLSRYEQLSLLEKTIPEYKKIMIMQRSSYIPLDDASLNELARLNRMHQEIFQNVR